jgi:uncharacterized protein YdcH (DUF465 family)
MKKIQIKIDKDAKACAIYISGKLIDLSIPYGWHYFYIFGYRIDYEDVFIAFLNALACETEEELDYFKPLLENFISNLRSTENGYWRDVLNKLNEEILKADDSKVRSSDRSIEIVYKQKLSMFVRNKDEFFYVNNMQISKSADMFLYFHKAAFAETKEELELISPMLDLQDSNWREKAKTIKEALIDNDLI